MSTKLDNNLLRIDALLRQAVALIWNSLPPEKRTADEAQGEALRLLMRVVQNFADDIAVFGGQSATEAPSAASTVRERNPNTGKPWTAQHDEELRALFESGNTVADLALYFQRTANAVRARLVKLGLLDPQAFRSRFAA